VPSGGAPDFSSTGIYIIPTTLSSGTHTYYVSAVNGCGESSTRRVVNITINQIPAVPSVSPVDTIICPGTWATLRVSGELGATFKWYNSSIGGVSIHNGATYLINPSVLTKYYVSQTVNSCESIGRDSATVEVAIHNIPKLVNGSYCDSDAGYYYSGNVYTEGIYYDIIIPGETACDTSVTLVVVKNPTYDINIFDTICYGESYHFDGNDYTETGIYQANLNTSLGCDSIVKLNLNVEKGCNSQTITAEKDYYELTYGYLPNPFTFNVTVSTGLPVTLDVSGTSVDAQISANTCLVTIKGVGITVITLRQTGNDYYAPTETSVTVVVNPARLIIIANSFNIKMGDTYPTFSYWTDGLVYGETNSVITKLPVFYCSVTNTDIMGEYPIIISGAEADNYEIEYKNGVLEIRETTRKLPNAFTPYVPDGLNDIFGAGYDLYIFNRWGSCLYKGNSGWDGKYKGTFVASGTYYYYAKDSDGAEYSGSVTLIKQF
jgi:gliding motility-associated-like protein